jgi:type IX secretion system PorP/SprF family membrane protein
MKHYYKLLFLVLAGTHLITGGLAQDVGFSQFYDQPLLRNPALAGIFTGDVRFTAAYRNQWQSVTVPYRTFALSGEVKSAINIVPDDNVTIGLQLIRDVAGTSEFSTMQILPAVNYSLPLSEESNSFLSIGLMGGLMQQRFDPSKLVLNDQFVAGSNGSFSVLPTSRQVFDNTNANYFDLSAGLSYNGVIKDDIDYFVGAGIFHITKPQVGFFKGNTITLNKKLTFNAGLSAPTSETDQFIVYLDYFKQYGDKFKPVGVSTFQAGMMFRRDLFVLGDLQQTITGGVLYRLNDAIIPVIQLQLSKLIIGASYDINVDKLSVAAQRRGGFELTLSYRDFLNSSQQERRQVICPRFSR